VLENLTLENAGMKSRIYLQDL